MNRIHCNFMEESHFGAGWLSLLPWQQSNSERGERNGWADRMRLRQGTPIHTADVGGNLSDPLLWRLNTISPQSLFGCHIRNQTHLIKKTDLWSRFSHLPITSI